MDKEDEKIDEMTEERIANLVAKFRELQSRACKFEEDAMRYKLLRSLANLRTFWAVPILMCSGPIGGYVTFDEAVDRLSERVNNTHTSQVYYKN